MDHREISGDAQDSSCVGPDEVNCTVVTTFDCWVDLGNPVKLVGTFDDGSLWSILTIQRRCCIGISAVFSSTQTIKASYFNPVGPGRQFPEHNRSHPPPG